MDHMSDICHIETPCIHIGGHQDLQVSFPEFLHDIIPLGLGQIAVKGRGPGLEGMVI